MRKTVLWIRPWLSIVRRRNLSEYGAAFVESRRDNGVRRRAKGVLPGGPRLRRLLAMGVSGARSSPVSERDRFLLTLEEVSGLVFFVFSFPFVFLGGAGETALGTCAGPWAGAWGSTIGTGEGAGRGAGVQAEPSCSTPALEPGTGLVSGSSGSSGMGESRVRPPLGQKPGAGVDGRWNSSPGSASAGWDGRPAINSGASANASDTNGPSTIDCLPR